MSGEILNCDSDSDAAGESCDVAVDLKSPGGLIELAEKLQYLEHLKPAKIKIRQQSTIMWVFTQ